MTPFRLVAVAALACALTGCQALKDDPILGDNAWEPGSRKAPNQRLDLPSKVEGSGRKVED
jgi:hypothetical protein